MHNNKAWMPKPTSPVTKNQLILPVGRRVFLNLPGGEVSGDFLPFGLKPGASPSTALRDGQEVEIIAWRPMAPAGLSYQIQRVSDQREWWTPATCLRKLKAAQVASAE
jgi:hypothetical protein